MSIEHLSANEQRTETFPQTVASPEIISENAVYHSRILHHIKSVAETKFFVKR